MIYNWYPIFNRAEFEALELPSKQYTMFLDGVGQKTFLVTQGNTVSVSFDDTMICMDVFADSDGRFVKDTFALFEADDGTVYWGVEVED